MSPRETAQTVGALLDEALAKLQVELQPLDEPIESFAGARRRLRQAVVLGITRCGPDGHAPQRLRAAYWHIERAWTIGN